MPSVAVGKRMDGHQPVMQSCGHFVGRHLSGSDPYGSIIAKIFQFDR
jgi:hypothetical protein